MASKQPSEQEIQFRKRARRRLIGAIALVLLMVTLLPMVLDDQRDQAPQPEIAISIPSQEDADFESRIVPVEPSPVPDQKEAPVVSSPAEPAAEPEPVPAKPAEQSEPAEQSKPAPEQLEVQIGVYSDAANVKKLQKQLADKGLKTYTETVDTAGGKKISLRMGPYASRAEADKAIAALKAVGMTGIVKTR